MAMATFLWQHRGSAVRTLDFARRLPQALSGGDRNAAASYGTQLTRNFPQSKEARALQAGIEE